MFWGQTSLGCDTVTSQQEKTQHQTFGPCNSFYCLGHSKHVYDDDDDDSSTRIILLTLVGRGTSGWDTHDWRRRRRRSRWWSSPTLSNHCTYTTHTRHSSTLPLHHHLYSATNHADGPARRTASLAPCCTTQQLTVVPRHRLYPLLDAEHSLCTAPWSGTPCRTTSAHSRTISPLDRAWKPGFSPDTSVFSALETI